MDFIFHIEAEILLFIQEYIRQDWMNGFWKFITMLGNSGWFWIAVSVLLLIPKRTRIIGITALIALAVGALITNVALKHLVARIRPYELIDGLNLMIEKQKDYSFPSGHTCASFAASMVYLKMMPRKYGVPFVVLAALIAFSRLYVGVHFPTDVIGGLIIGIFSAWTAVHLMHYFCKTKLKKDELES